MIILYWKNRRKRPEPKSTFENLPIVTVQLPIFNELHVVQRLISAVSSLDYPKDCLQIQILDDSIDETKEICEKEYAKLIEKGFDVELIHRNDRVGYKAGALENGMKSAKGEYIYILDADFVPEPDVLHKMIHFLNIFTKNSFLCTFDNLKVCW